MSAVSGERVPPPVARALARAQLSHEADLGPPGQRRAERPAPGRLGEGRVDAGRRRVAVERDPAAHHVVARGRVSDRPRRVGGVQAAAAPAARPLPSASAQPRSARAARREGVLRIVGDREVGPEPRVAPAPVPRPPPRRSRSRSAGSAPTRCMPVSTLTSTSTGRRAPAAARRIAFRPALVCRRSGSARARRLLPSPHPRARTGPGSAR